MVVLLTEYTLISVLVGLAILALLFWGLWAFLIKPRQLAKRGRSIAELRQPPRSPSGALTRPGVRGQPSVSSKLGEATPEIVVEKIIPSLDTPEASATRLSRLRSRLAKSGSPLGARLLQLLSRDNLTDDDWDSIEETLLVADVGAGPAEELVQALKTRVRVEGTSDPVRVKEMLREELIKLVDPNLDRSLNLTGHPAVVLVVGVNGTGKTTTIGKLARVLVADGHTVLLGASDTFRAAAADQLQTWGSRVGVETVRALSEGRIGVEMQGAGLGSEPAVRRERGVGELPERVDNAAGRPKANLRDGADPAAVAFEAVKTGKEQGIDVVVVDTAGRLQNKTGLMDELGKITRVINKEAALSEVLLVLDATTGQNGMQQARVFSQVAGVTGIVLTKLDGTARGGIVIAVQRELGVPVKLVGLGEGPDDLAPFDAAQFVDGILG